MLTALRRREGWLELRVVRLQPDCGRSASDSRSLGDGDGSRRATPTCSVGAGSEIPVQGDDIAVPLTGWEIRTLQLRTVGGP